VVLAESNIIYRPIQTKSELELGKVSIEIPFWEFNDAAITTGASEESMRLFSKSRDPSLRSG
jgi:hypothetical protein